MSKRTTVHLQNSMGTRCGLWEKRTTKTPIKTSANIEEVNCGRCININWHDKQRKEEAK